MDIRFDLFNPSERYADRRHTSGCTETKAKKKHRLIYLSSTDFTTGDLIRLDRMEVCGRKWLEHGNALTLGLIMKNDDDYVTVKRCLYL